MRNQFSLAILVALQLGFQSSFAEKKPKESKAFEAFKKKSKDNVLPDFSYAGYKHGEEAIPKVDYKIFDITSFGAIANDDKSDKAAIESAIKAAQNNGSGVIFFPKGKFLINEETDSLSTINITKSNIVFRGSGSEEGGTELFMKRKLKATDTTKMWTGIPMFRFYSTQKDEYVSGIRESAKAGSFTLELINASKLKAGDWVQLSLRQVDNYLVSNELMGHEASPKWINILQNPGITIDEMHYVKSVEGNKVTLYSPTGYDIDVNHNWKVNKFNAIENVGIEGIRFVGGFTYPFKHHRSWVDDSGWNMLRFSKTVNCWLRDCVFKDVSIGCEIGGSANFTALNNKLIGNPVHEAIYSGASTNVLIAKCADEAGFWHSIGVNSRSMNTVIWRCSYTPSTCFECHSSQPRNTLIDMMEGGFRPSHCGGSENNLPHHMQNLILWNYKKTNNDYPIVNFWPEGKIHEFRIPGPIVVGMHGEPSEFDNQQLKYSESIGTPVFPMSLYEAQLELRLGKLPDWVKEAIK